MAAALIANMAETPAPAAGQSRSWVPSLPNLTSILDGMNPFAAAEKPQDASDDAKNIADGKAANAQSKKRPSLAQDGPPSPSRSSGSIMFAEPTDSQITSPTGSRDGSPERRRSKKSNKPKTSFSICHPPPASAARQKLHRTPRSLLQLHKVNPNARPTPAFEVIPSASFSARLTKAIIKVFKGRHTLCPNDLVILRAEKYYTEGQEEEQEARDVLALVCKGRKEDSTNNNGNGKAKICMADGAEWEAYPMPNGGYEFYTTDSHGLGLTVRWVPKRTKDNTKDPKRFNFSTISPNSRRHPVIANLTKSSLHVSDTYKMPSDAAALTPSATPTATPNQKSTILADTFRNDSLSSEPETRTTDTLLREIITVTAIWVTFKEGWSPFFKYDDLPCTTNPTLGSQPSANNSRKSVTSPVSTPPNSPGMAAANGLDKRNSIRSVGSSLFRRGSSRNYNRNASQNRHSTISLESNAEDGVARSGSVAHKGRTRAESNATVLVHRAASNRRRAQSTATWRPDLLAAGRPEGIDEGSREDVSRRTPTPTPVTKTAVEDDQHADESEDEDEVEATPTRRGRTPTVKRESLGQTAGRERERESTATSSTGGSVEASKAKAKVKSESGRKKGWRRLFCGNS